MDTGKRPSEKMMAQMMIEAVHDYHRLVLGGQAIEILDGYYRRRLEIDLNAGTPRDVAEARAVEGMKDMMGWVIEEWQELKRTDDVSKANDDEREPK